MEGYGTLVTFDLRAGTEAGTRFAEALELFSITASLGSTESLVVAPAMQQPRGLSEEQRRWTDIGPGTVRLSIGIEDPDDLVADLRRGTRPQPRLTALRRCATAPRRGSPLGGSGMLWRNNAGRYRSWMRRPAIGLQARRLARRTRCISDVRSDGVLRTRRCPAHIAARARGQPRRGGQPPGTAARALADRLAAAATQKLRKEIRRLRELLGGSQRDRRYIVGADDGGFALIAHLELLRPAGTAPVRPEIRSLAGRLQAFVVELRRRNVFKVGWHLPRGMWIVLQVAEVTFEPLRLPGWWMTGLTILRRPRPADRRRARVSVRDHPRAASCSTRRDHPGVKLAACASRHRPRSRWPGCH